MCACMWQIRFIEPAGVPAGCWCRGAKQSLNVALGHCNDFSRASMKVALRWNMIGFDSTAAWLQCGAVTELQKLTGWNRTVHVESLLLIYTHLNKQCVCVCVWVWVCVCECEWEIYKSVIWLLSPSGRPSLALPLPCSVGSARSGRYKRVNTFPAWDHSLSAKQNTQNIETCKKPTDTDKAGR